jgi:hypothetical protein
MLSGIPDAGGHRLVQGKGHDQDQTVETVGVTDLSVLDPETAGFEVGEHRLDPPAPAIFQGFQISWLVGHGDNPRFGVAWILDDADVGPRPLGGQFDVFQIEDPVFGAGRGRCLASSVAHGQITFQAQPIAPGLFLAPADQISGA